MPVYIIETEKLYKIGFSLNPEKRINQLQTGNGDLLKIKAVIDGEMHHEKTLHNLLKIIERMASGL